MATSKQLETFYKDNIKLIGESFEDFQAEHQKYTIDEIIQKYFSTVELGKQMNKP